MDGATVVYESTGRWHREFEESLAGRLPLPPADPLRARRFAQPMGEGAKTDQADARVLAAMGAKLDLRRGALRDLAELVTAHDAQVKERTAATNRRKHARHGLADKHLEQRLARIAKQIKDLDEEIAKLIGSDGELSRRTEVLTSIPGVGPVVAATLLAAMPELGRIDGKATASLAGIAPLARDSGHRKGAPLHRRRAEANGTGQKPRREP